MRRTRSPAPPNSRPAPFASTRFQQRPRPRQARRESRALLRVDLHPISTPPTPEEVAAIESVLVAHAEDADTGFGKPEARRRRQLLLPALHAVQARFGWVSPGALGYICDR